MEQFKFIGFLWFLIPVLFVISVRALESNAESANEDLIIKEKVRKRLYPGGRDEEPLQVQVQLGAPVRKGVSTEETAEPSDEASSQDDGF